MTQKQQTNQQLQQRIDRLERRLERYRGKKRQDQDGQSIDHSQDMLIKDSDSASIESRQSKQSITKAEHRRRGKVAAESVN